MVSHKIEGAEMKYLPLELKQEYIRLTELYPDRPELAHPFINLSDAFRAYFILADYFTDQSCGEERERMLIGVRSVDLLDSALGRQIVSFCGITKYTRPLDVCATLFYGMVKNHSFSDGNKRTALLLLLYQLYLYGYMPSSPKKDFENLVVSIADNSISEKYHVYKKFKKKDDPIIQTISFLLRKMVKKKDNTYHVSPTMREFCEALRSYNVNYKIENGKVHFSYNGSGIWEKLIQKQSNYSINFGGWTRTVGAKTAREVLCSLHLYDQFSTYQDLLNGSEPFYTLIDDFKEPLKRLKDK